MRWASACSRSSASLAVPPRLLTAKTTENTDNTFSEQSRAHPPEGPSEALYPTRTQRAGQA